MASKRYQISHYFKTWISAESFNTLGVATKFARRVMKANKNMKSVKVIDRKTRKVKFVLNRKKS